MLLPIISGFTQSVAASSVTKEMKMNTILWYNFNPVPTPKYKVGTELIDKEYRYLWKVRRVVQLENGTTMYMVRGQFLTGKQLADAYWKIM